MKIEAPVPESIHAALDQTFQWSDRYLPPTLLLGRIKPVSGLFSAVAAKIDVVYPEPTGYSLYLEVAHFDRNYNFWSQDDSTKLLTEAERSSSLPHGLFTKEGFRYIDALDSANKVKFRTLLGWENDRAGWLYQVRETDKALRAEQITDPHPKARVEEDFQYLLKNPTVLPKSEGLYLVMVGPDSKADEEGSEYLAFEEERPLVSKLKSFTAYSQTMLNAMLSLRGIEQHDELVLRHPAENNPTYVPDSPDQSPW